MLEWINKMRLVISGIAVQFAGCPTAAAFQDILLRGAVIADDKSGEGDIAQVCLAAMADASTRAGDALTFLLPAPLAAQDFLPLEGLGAVSTLPGGPGWLFAALQQAQRSLTDGSVDAVVVAACHPYRGGAAAVVLQCLPDALQHHRRVYAVLDPGHSAPAAGSLELGGPLGSGLAALHPDCLQPLLAPTCGLLQCAVSSAAETLGSAGALADLTALIKSSLSLHCRTHYAVPRWQGPHNPAAWEQSPFYFPTDSRPWFQGADAGLRQAVLACENESGEWAGLTLTEEPQLRFPAQAVFRPAGAQLLPLQADSQAALLENLAQLSTELAWCESLPALAGQYLAACQNQPAPAFTLGLVSASLEELGKEIEHAQRGVARAFETGADWQSPAGSAFSARPLGAQAGVAFVYPGGFNSHVGMAQDLFALFPWLQDRLGELTDQSDLSLQSRLIYPRSVVPLTAAQLAALEAHLNQDAIPMLTTGTAAAFLYTSILQDAFGLRPASAFGYSLGENSMMFAQGVWQAADEARNHLTLSPLFQSRLAGAQQAVRQHWGWPLLEEGQRQEPVWGNFVLMADAEIVQAALTEEEHVYLTHINAPRQVVIGGEIAACQRVIAALKCMSLQAPYDYALHCEAMASEFFRLEELHTLPVAFIPETVLYTAADYQPVRLDAALIADNIATALTNRLDFPRLVERVYQDGARIFIEVGAGSNCSKMIAAILKGKPHAALWVDQARVSEQTMLVRLLARLLSQGIPIDLSALLPAQVSEGVGESLCLLDR